MNRMTSSSHSPRNVMGCQWQETERSNIPKSSFVLSMEKSRRCSKFDGSVSSTVTTSSTVEGLDLKLENDRRLQEMREQGKQCLMERNETSTHEEGAANLLARFHSMPWARQHYSETMTTGPSQSIRTVNCSRVNLVPVKHEEEAAYFPGTRPQKKTKRAKNTRPKYELAKLEEAVPKPTERIPPAGYQSQPPSAWAVRKGSDLFESRKLNLTIYGPSNSDGLLQRAMEESLITLAQEEDRFVSMYSPQLDNSKEDRSCKNSTKVGLNSWDGKSDIPVGDGSGDGSWMQADNNKSEDNLDITSQKEDTNYNYKMSHKDHFKSSYNSARNTEKSSPQLGAGDYMYNGQSDRRLCRQTKEKSKDSMNKNYEPESTNGNYQDNYKGRDRDEDMELESLGFSKKRDEPRQYGTTQRRGQMQDRGNSINQEKPQPHKTSTMSGEKPGGRNIKSVRGRHVRFSDPLVQDLEKKSGTRSSKSEDDDNDDNPWLEQDEWPHKELIAAVPLPHIQPHEKLTCQRELEIKSHYCASQKVGVNDVKTTSLVEDTKQNPTSIKSEIQIIPMKQTEDKADSSPKMESSTPPDHVQELPDTTVRDSPKENDILKEMQEQINFLDTRVKMLTTALEQCNNTESDEPTKIESKACSPIPSEVQKSSLLKGCSSLPPEVQKTPELATLASDKLAKPNDERTAPDSRLQLLPRSLPQGFVHPQGVPVVQPFAHHSMHVKTTQHAHPHPKANSEDPQANLLINSSTCPPGFPLGHPSVLHVVNPSVQLQTQQLMPMQASCPGVQTGAQQAHKVTPEMLQTYCQQTRKAEGSTPNSQLLSQQTQASAAKSQALVQQAQECAAKSKPQTQQAQESVVKTQLQAQQPQTYGVNPLLQAQQAQAYVMKPQLQVFQAQPYVVNPQVQALQTQAHGVNPQVQALQTQAHGVNPQVQALQTQAHGVNPQVQAQQAQAYGVNPQLQAQQAQAYGVNPQLQAQQAQAYGVNPQRQAQQAQAYLVNPLVQAQQAQAYGVNPQVQAQQAQAYGVNPLVQALQAQAYGVNPQVQAQQAQAYSVNQQVQAQQAQAYSVNQQMQAQQAQTYSVNQQVQAQQAQASAVYSVMQARLAMSWLGVRPPFNQPGPVPLQMYMVAGQETGNNIHAGSSAAVHSSVLNSEHVQVNEGVLRAETGSQENPHLSKSNTPAVGSPESGVTDSLPGNDLLTNTASQDPTGRSANNVPIGDNKCSALETWFAQMKAQQQQQQHFVHVASAMPGMRMQLPVQPAFTVVPSALGTSGANLQAGSGQGNIPPQYEGDWIISLDDEARLGQGLPLVRNEHPGITNGRGQTNFSGLPAPATLKPPHPLAPLAGLKQQQPLDLQVPDSESLNLTDFNPAVLPPQRQGNPNKTMACGNVSHTPIYWSGM